MGIDQAELNKRFDFHPANEVTGPLHDAVRATVKEAAERLIEITGHPSRQQSLAVTALEEAMHWANAAIACEPPEFGVEHLDGLTGARLLELSGGESVGRSGYAIAVGSERGALLAARLIGTRDAVLMRRHLGDAEWQLVRTAS